MHIRILFSVLLVGFGLLPKAMQAQNVTAFITDLDRFERFEKGSFSQLESRTPQWFHIAGDRVLYRSNGGDVKMYADGRTTTIERGVEVVPMVSDHLVAYTIGSILKVVTERGAEIISYNAANVKVQDSLIVFHDQAQRQVNVYWRGNVTTVADALINDGGMDFQAGTNTFVFPDASVREIVAFYRGELFRLCDLDQRSRVATGGEVIAFVDGYDLQFRVMWKGGFLDLEPIAPSSFQAGDGLVAYVDVSGAFKCFKDGKIYTLASQPPSVYKVIDNTLVFVDQGMLKTLANGAVEVVERFVPEKWEISGDALVYLDLNRTLWMFRNGERIQVSNTANITTFDNYRGLVVYRSGRNAIHVWWNGERYQMY